MIKFLQCLFLVLAVISTSTSCENNTVYQEKILLHDYPSASGIEYVDSMFAVIGDDSRNLIFLDSALRPVDSILLYAFAQKRIPKDIKSDLEAITITRDKKLFLLGSGSLSPYRNVAWLVDRVKKQKELILLDTFYDRLKHSGLEEINIEGCTRIAGNFILANRGSKGYPKNHLVIAPDNFFQDQGAPYSLVQTGASGDTAKFNGISGLAYSAKSDRLIMTVSTEDTRNALDDGAIGKSYIWIINNFSAKKRWKAINPDQVIDLAEVDGEFRGQKIGSVCINKETGDFLHLVLAADNDNGSSSFFRIIVEKE